MTCRPPDSIIPLLEVWKTMLTIPKMQFTALLRNCPRLLAILAGVLLFASAPASASVLDFNLHNETGLTISHVYISPSSLGDWGSDALGSDVLYEREGGRIYFSSYAESNYRY